jgi:hypothetical protein
MQKNELTTMNWEHKKLAALHELFYVSNRCNLRNLRMMFFKYEKQHTNLDGRANVSSICPRMANETNRLVSRLEQDGIVVLPDPD